MSCAIAVSNSPVFSPSRVSAFCKTTVSSPESISLNHLGSSSLSSPCSSSSSTGGGGGAPSSPFRGVRLQKSPCGLRVCNNKEELFGNSHGTTGFNLGPAPSSSSSAAAALKRKRPARLDIPAVASLSFAPAETSLITEMEVERDEYSVYCKKGRREAMEDRYSAAVDLQGDPKQAFFGIYDGHGGTKAAEYAAENVDKNIMNELARRSDEEVVESVRNGYLTTDMDFLKEDSSGGSCCVTALIRKGDLVVSNAGDCRAVISRGGTAEALTSDHRPSREDEKERIRAQGGYVDLCRGVWRLQGTLAVSRGIGDRHLKKWVIAEPETKVIRIEPDCEFLILASDGLWDKVDNQETIDIARPLLVDNNDSATALIACKRLVDLAAKRGSSDDISVMVIKLGKFV